MSQSELPFRRQAEWQKARQALSWPEKIRLAEKMRATAAAFRQQRQRRQASPAVSAAADTADRTRPA